MKRTIFLFLTIALTVASCNTTKLATQSIDKFLKDHNFQQTSSYDEFTQATTITASIENLYSTVELEKICSKADVTFRIVKGRVELTASCPGAEQQIRAIFGELFKKIVFK